MLPLLPKTIQQPRVDKFDPDAAPVLSLALSANQPVRDITEYADKVLRRQLESVNGVGQVLVARRPPAPDQRLARRRPAARLQPDRHRRLARAAGAEHRNSRRPRRSGPAVGDAAHARPRPDASPSSTTSSSASRTGIRSGSRDVARVEDGEADADTRRQRQRQPAPCCCRSAASRAPTRSKSSKAVKERLDELKAALPPGYDIRIVRDPSEFIEASIHNVEEHLDRRLDPRRARRAALPDERALDDHRRDRHPDLDHRDLRADLVHGLHAQLDDHAGADARRSASSSTTRSWCSRTSTASSRRSTRTSSRRRSTRPQEIGLAVLATTLSLVAIFVPVGFMGGIVGRFMKSFGLTMAFAIMVSLLVSFTLTPMLSARWLKVEAARRKTTHASKDSRVFHAVDVVLHADARVVDGAPRRSSPASRCWCCCRACRCS